MTSIGYIGFLNYAISLWLLTGFIILRVEAKEYELAGMKKERKVSRFVGWLNIGLGLLLFFGNWIL